VLDGARRVVAAAHDVSLDEGRLAEVAGWMAYEELPRPAFILPFPLELERDAVVDFVLTATCVNFAFTNFETRERWDVGRFADADARISASSAHWEKASRCWTAGGSRR
jgi:hypothetical protein